MCMQQSAWPARPVPTSSLSARPSPSPRGCRGRSGPRQGDKRRNPRGRAGWPRLEPAPQPPERLSRRECRGIGGRRAGRRRAASGGDDLGGQRPWETLPQGHEVTDGQTDPPGGDSSGAGTAAKRIPQLPEAPSASMFHPPGCRRSFPREPAPWWDGPWPCPPDGPEDTWDGPPWDGPPWDEPPWDEPPWDEPPWDGPPWDEPPWDGPPWDGPPWDGPPWEQQPRRRRRRRGPPSPRAFPGPGDVPWNEEEQDRRWAPPECPLPPPWPDRAAVPGAEGDFGECWYQDPPPDPWPEYPEEKQPQPQPQPWPPSGPAGNPGNFPQHRPPWSHHPAGTRRSRPRQLLPVPRAWCPRPSRGHKPRSRRSQPGARKEPQPPEPPQRPEPPPGAAERQEQPQDVPAGTGGVLEPPNPARSPLESPAADGGADPGAAELQVELGAGHSPVGSQDQGPCAPGADPAPPEETSRNPEIQEHLEAEPCGVPRAGGGHGSPPQSPAAPPDPARREILECSSSGEAELSPRSCGAGETEARAAQAGPLQSLHPPENPQLPPGPAAEPKAQPSRAAPAACTPPETSTAPQSPPGAGATNQVRGRGVPSVPPGLGALPEPRGVPVAAGCGV
ncbi:basic proline-rich protein-like [Melospiza melodia melodia]|uniref:basic proline-rich protein-like n=1 Tax=Melospiza melodia melodia TaxID=1914991 RepID=UPI002FD75499